MITTFDLDEYVYAALRAGARGFLLKDAGPETARPGRPRGRGRRRADRAEYHRAPAQGVRQSGPASRSAQPIEPLTDREEEVLATVASGRTNSEIAAELHITLSTVKTHIASLMAKLGVRNRVEIAMWAYEHRGSPADHELMVILDGVFAPTTS